MTQQKPVFPTLIWLEREFLVETPAPVVLEWLFHPDSLTRRLTALSSDHFNVTPLFEGWQPLRDDECTALDLPEQSVGWVREVYLRGRGEKWVFARSVAARKALQEGGLNMGELGARSLGELLFCDEAFLRGPLQICRYPVDWLPAPDAADQLWGRRSCFSRGPLKILVAEVFLPTLWRAIENGENC
ncbi:chorismate--pyruvate lyase family protein [Pseudomonas sp. DWP3-1-2]|uniref:chorismate--pyruvate lyase family protein n=1 Tax=Pseudomonas sp. DWP3-1-2 TaxID=2804645 RepID=UPI003CF93B10